MGGWTYRELRTRAPLVGAALLIHVIVLLPMALSVPRVLPTPDLPDLIVLPLDLTPAMSGRPARVSGVPPRLRRPTVDAAAVRAPPPSEARTGPTRPAAAATADAGPAIDDGWRVRAGLNPPARLPCPAPPGDRLGQRLCLVGAAPDRDRTPETYAEVTPSRASASDQAREEGFDRQAQANEAWRSYTRGEGAYPGLRSLFGER